MTECYVCLNERPILIKPCGCNALVHEECLIKVIKSVPAHADRCPVCKTNYGLVKTFKYELQRSPYWLSFISVNISFALIIWAVIHVDVWRKLHGYYTSIIWYVIVGSIVSLDIFIFLWFLVYHYYKTGFICFVKLDKSLDTVNLIEKNMSV